MKTSILKNLLNEPFTILDSKLNKIFVIIFCGLFSSLFIFLFNPFNAQNWNYPSALGSSLPIYWGGILGMPVLFFTHFGLRGLFGLFTFKIWQFLTWILMEMILLTLLFLFVFGTPQTEGNTYFNEFTTVLGHTSLLLMIPYPMAVLILRSIRKPQTLVVSEPELILELPDLIDFPDEKGKIALTLKWEHLLFLKSEDNYINVHYLHNSVVEKKLVRTNLKKLSGTIDHPMLIRTHRSFMVNIENVISLDRSKRGLKLNLKQLSEVQIPVSATYKKKVEAILRDQNS